MSTGTRLQVIVGLALLVAGISFPVTRDPAAQGLGWQVPLGALLTALGGAFLSWIASTHMAQVDAEQAFRQRMADTLGPLTKAVGQKSGQIIETVNRGVQGDTDEVTALEIIYQLTRTIQADVVALADLSNTPYTKDPTVETIGMMDALARELRNDPDNSEAVAELEQIKDHLAAKRQVDPLVDTPPAPVSKRRVRVNCPVCHGRLSVQVKTNTASTLVSCLTCLTEIDVTYPELDLTVIGQLQPAESVEIVGLSGNRPVVNCEAGNHQVWSQMLYDDVYYAICREHSTIHATTIERLRDWRLANNVS